jgi:zinc transport system permease protein
MFEFSFMIRALEAGILVGIICPILGTFLVIRRYSRLPDTLAHISLAGVAVGIFTKTDPVLATMAVSVIAAIGIEKMRATRHIFGESVLALFHWTGMAIAVVLISLARGFNTGLFGFLFGSITTVSSSELSLLVVVAVVIITFILLFYKELFFVAFDEELARVNGVRAGTFNLVMVVFSAVTVALAMRIVGILLIGALMVIPVITAMLVSRSFRQTLMLSVILSIVSVVTGLVLSYYFDLASGGTIVLTTVTLFLIVWGSGIRS